VEIRVRDVPEQFVVTEQRMVDQPALEAWLPGAMTRVLQAAGDAAVGTDQARYLERDKWPNEPVFVVIYEGNPNEGEVAVEICTPVAGEPPGVATRTVPAHREAYARITKATVESGGLGAVYGDVEQWIDARGFQVAGAPRETYWTDFYAATADDDVFDVAWPML
jgi:effector-binding domain-containing protein